MSRTRMWLALFAPLALAPISSPAPAVAQATSQDPGAAKSKVATDTPAIRLIQALAADPVTAPYGFSATSAGGRVVLKGRVGTKVAHDQAVQIAIAAGVSIDDRLVIDTAETVRAAAATGAGAPPAAYSPGATAFSVPAATSRPGTVPYVYPQPLFGYYDDPFYGFDPPVISYPPWWGALSAARLGPALGGVPVQGQTQQSREVYIPAASGNEQGRVEMTIDGRGNAVLRGTVPTEADKAKVERKLSEMPGITGIDNQIEVRGIDEPPPPPTPAVLPGQRPNVGRMPAPAPRPQAAPRDRAIRVDGPADDRLAKALARRPALAGLPISVSLSDGVATMTGKVHSCLEAMLAFRAIQQVPGVREVDDRLEFPVPAEGEKNPLIEVGRPDDVEPYLEAQIRRQLGDKAHVDRVRIHGNSLDVTGTLRNAEDKPRVDAVLRSFPLLRGFHTTAQFLPE